MKKKGSHIIKGINLLWSLIWGILSSIAYFTGFEIVSVSYFGRNYSSELYILVKIAFMLSTILWFIAAIYLFFDIKSKKKKLYFIRKGQLLLYCLSSIILGIILWYLFTYFLVLVFD
jgi:hypothetical protein